MRGRVERPAVSQYPQPVRLDRDLPAGQLGKQGSNTLSPALALSTMALS